ncbi:hypothetical protein F7Q99_20030 [Streptomyces kaniharaensis]|uniref:Uncharacterized protein n=1 Tax=Streptomyces kaniharaensis TaxID=212423 RepID=A0A6N7KSJ4_9ACTN|nr:hypothetical protein [Streptomyces kaniharaensis]MQS14490.1 hypothetical protein [Streptomyces kaniharaensis]
MSQPQPAEPLDLDAIQARHTLPVEPNGCGTCRDRARDGQKPIHYGCERRATLLPAPDAPDYETLLDLTDAQRRGLPTRFHTPVWEGNAEPNAWLCAVCWGDGWVTQWPCPTAAEHGSDVFTPEDLAERARTDVEQLLARVRELEAERALYVGVEPTIAQELAYRSSEIDRLEAEYERLRTAWHSAKTRARTAREHLELAEHGRDCATEAIEQLQTTLSQMPRCQAPHPVADDARCELIIQHPGWHAAHVGAWPHASWPFTPQT